MKLFSWMLPALVTGSLALSCLTPSFAADGNAAMQACRDDHRKFCAKVKPGGGRIADCLGQHQAALAPACQAALGTLTECSQQLKKICAGEGDDPTTLRACAKAHASELTETCRKATALR